MVLMGLMVVIILYRSSAACEKSFKGYVKIIVLRPEYLLRLPQCFLRGMEIEDDMIFLFSFLIHIIQKDTLVSLTIYLTALLPSVKFLDVSQECAELLVRQTAPAQPFPLLI